MRKISLLIMSFVVTIFLNTTLAHAFKEGQWSMSMMMKSDEINSEHAKAMKEMDKMSPEEKAMMQQMMGGMGISADAAGMTVNLSQCLTNDNPVPKKDQDINCQETHSMRGNTLKFETTCPDSKSSGEITYTNDSMHGNIQSTHLENGKNVNVAMEISGQYQGPCDASASNAMNNLKPILSQKELELKQKEIELQSQQLELERQKLQMQAESNNQSESKSAKSKNPSLNDVSNAVDTGNKIKNTFGGLRSLLGR